MLRNKGRLKSVCGYSLPELIISLVVLSIGLGTLTLVTREASIRNSESHYVVVAAGLAQEKIEEILSNDFSSVAVGTTVESSITNFSSFTRTTTVAYVNAGNLNGSAGGATNYKRVSVAISPKSAGLGPTIDIVTLMTDY